MDVNAAHAVLSDNGTLVANTPCCLYLVLFSVFVLCLVYPMLSLSLDCPFLIASSVFSNVYSSSTDILDGTLQLVQVNTTVHFFSKTGKGTRADVFIHNLSCWMQINLQNIVFYLLIVFED